MVKKGVINPENEKDVLNRLSQLPFTMKRFNHTSRANSCNYKYNWNGTDFAAKLEG